MFDLTGGSCDAGVATVPYLQRMLAGSPREREKMRERKNELASTAMPQPIRGDNVTHRVVTPLAICPKVRCRLARRHLRASLMGQQQQ